MVGLYPCNIIILYPLPGILIQTIGKVDTNHRSLSLVLSRIQTNVLPSRGYDTGEVWVDPPSDLTMKTETSTRGDASVSHDGFLLSYAQARAVH